MYSDDKAEVKRLRNEVQLLRDELAKMNRAFEDILCNLDTDNFSSRFVKEQSDLRTAIEVTAEGIKTKVSKRDLDKELEQYTSISQTYEAIESVASKSVDLNNATKIYYDSDKKIDPEEDFTNENLIYAATATDTGDRYGKVLSVTYYYYNDTVKKWQTLSGNTIYTIFKQTNEGFEFLGNVLIDGDLITKGTISAERISTDISNVYKTLYIGDPETTNETKSIYFVTGANISTFEDRTGLLTGIRINASTIKFGYDETTWVDFTNTKVIGLKITFG